MFNLKRNSMAWEIASKRSKTLLECNVTSEMCCLWTQIRKNYGKKGRKVLTMTEWTEKRGHRSRKEWKKNLQMYATLLLCDANAFWSLDIKDYCNWCKENVSWNVKRLHTEKLLTHRGLTNGMRSFCWFTTYYSGCIQKNFIHTEGGKDWPLVNPFLPLCVWSFSVFIHIKLFHDRVLHYRLPLNFLTIPITWTLFSSND